jgi:hypothetical protein
VHIYQNYHGQGPKAPQRPYINASVIEGEVRHIEDHKTLPKCIEHGNPEELKVVALVPVPCLVQLRVVKQGLVTKVFVKNANYYRWKRGVDEGIENTAPVCQCRCC